MGLLYTLAVPFLALLWTSQASGAATYKSSQTFDYISDEDLQSFVSRPDLRPPKFNISVRDPRRTAPGYWFVASYDKLQNRPASAEFVPDEMGPHIYDDFGNLVWSGAHLFKSRPTFDFKTATCNGSTCLTFILHPDRYNNKYRHGAAIVLDNTFTIRNTITPPEGSGINMHEFTVSPSGTATLITYRPRLVDVTSPYPPRDQQMLRAWVGDNGFREVDMATGKNLFEWWPLDHVHPSESLRARPKLPGASSSPWDFFHLNSIDKNSDGNYLVSSRYLNAIFKISGTDGHVIWQLGGRRSTFALQDGFNFSSQHDARLISENSTHATVSFLNNAADGFVASSSVSAAVTVLLDYKAKTAALVDNFQRPDHELTRLRGNVQHLPNGHKFICWSENARISELDGDGQLVLDASFASHRFVTYRAYKLNFTSAPVELPALKSFVYGPSDAEAQISTTALYVSWNGATEVRSWRFYSTGSAGENVKLIGDAQKDGFETTLMVSGAVCHAYAEGIAADGATVLGVSAVETSILPKGWDASTACDLASSSGDGSPLIGEQPTSFLNVNLAFSIRALTLIVSFSFALAVVVVTYVVRTTKIIRRVK